MTLDELNESVREFCEERNWTQFHTPKDLAIGMSTESNELLELFRFKDREAQNALLEDEESRADVEDEIADILFFTLRFSDLYDINLEEALNAKIEKNAEKYPQNQHQPSKKEGGEEQ